jgi:hypothetical protein
MGLGRPPLGSKDPRPVYDRRMTTLAQLRKAALALPETEEGTHFGMVAFSVRGKGFASVTKDGQVQLQLSDEDAEAAARAHRNGERLVRMGKPIGLRIPLVDTNDKDLNALVRSAWAHRAPKELATNLAAVAGDPKTCRRRSAGRRPRRCPRPV